MVNGGDLSVTGSGPGRSQVPPDRRAEFGVSNDSKSSERPDRAARAPTPAPSLGSIAGAITAGIRTYGAEPGGRASYNQCH